MDPAPRDPEDFHKIWTTTGGVSVQERKYLYEFADEDKYRKNESTKIHALELPFTGSANVIYNGSFFYFNQEKEAIVKFDLSTRDLRCISIPTGRQRQRVGELYVHNLTTTLFLALQMIPNQECRRIGRKVGPEFLTKLYPEMKGNIFVDLAIDENGLWAIMAMKENNNTLVMKLSAWNLELIWAWNITLNHNLVADMFIVCGVLYAVDRTDARDTKIR